MKSSLQCFKSRANFCTTDAHFRHLSLFLAYLILKPPSSLAVLAFFMLQLISVRFCLLKANKRTSLRPGVSSRSAGENLHCVILTQLRDFGGALQELGSFLPPAGCGIFRSLLPKPMCILNGRNKRSHGRAVLKISISRSAGCEIQKNEPWGVVVGSLRMSIQGAK